MKRDGRNRFKRGLVSLLAILLILQLTVPCLLVSADTEDTAAEEAVLAEEAYVEEPEEEETVPEEPVSEEADDVSTSDATPQEEAEDTVPKEDTEAELEEEEEDIEPEIEMESSEEWERELDRLTLTDDDWVENFVRIAASQLGYRENELTEAELESGYTQGWTRYGVWYGLPYEEWNTYFVDFCLYYAEVAGISFEPEVADWIYELGKDEMFTEPEDAEPKRGDLIFLDLYDNDGIADSVGIIEWALYDEDDQCEEIKVILGDYEDEVAEEAFYADDSRILGYTVLPEDPRSEKEVEENSVETEDLYEGDAQTFEDTVEGITVHVEAPAGAFPGETTMEVSPVEREAVLDAISQTIDGTIANVEAVDISFYNQGGEEIEPALPIRVLMSSQLIARKDEAPTVVHIRDNAGADVVPVDESAETSDSEVVFETVSFSVYALVYTVDFELTDESGYRYIFSLDGGSQITLSTLLAELGIMDRESAQKLIAEDVEDVTFSDESLVKVVKLEESTTLAEVRAENGLDVQEGAESTAYEAPDYLLMSLAAFDTAETLTITLRSGEQIVIQVTDERITGLNQIEDGARYLIYVQWSENGTCYVLKNDGTTAQVPAGELAGLGDEYYWEFRSKSGVTARDGNYNSINCYTIQAVTGNRRYLQPNEYPSTSQGATRLLVPWDDTYGCGVRQNDQGGTFNIGGLYDGPNGSYTYGGYLVLENNTLTENYWYATDVKLYKKSDTVTFNVKTENADMGTVSGRDYQYNELKEKTSFVAAGDNRSYNANPIYATPGANYEFAGWKWEGESGYAYTSSTIPAGALAVQAGKTLVATFKERSDIGDTGRRADRSLDAWIEGLLKHQIPLDGNSTSKTAEVYDYENRIYRVDLTAKSNLVTFNGTIDLGFILDMSGSMRFPSKLNKTGIALQLTNLNNGGDWQLDKNQVYYIITDAANTSTVRKVFYRSEWGIQNGWYIIDSSYADINQSVLIKEDTNYENAVNKVKPVLTYDFYTDGDSGKMRLDYLESSFKDSVTHMQTLLSRVNIATEDDPPELKVGYTTFANDKFIATTDFQKVSGQGGESIANGFKTDTQGGTRTDLAISEAASKLSWQDSDTKYAILITDGAPQGGGQSTPTLVNATKTNKSQLTNQDVKLITVGLSLENVQVGRQLLHDIADDVDGQKMYYGAESGDDLYYILLEILKKVMKEANVITDVADNIDPAFYPVDKATGQPLDVGDQIDLEGNKITGQPAGAFGVIAKNGDSYKVVWNSQDITSDAGWHGSVYIKAKEDFLGGNTIATNDGDAVFTPSSYYFPENPGRKYAFKDTFIEDNTYTRSTPSVNVDELTMTEENSEWTVYIGTEVDPVTQLKQFWKDIRVKLVVDNTTDRNTFVGGNMVYSLTESPDDGRPQMDPQSAELALTHCIGDLTDAQWNTLLQNGKVEVPYSAYGHTEVGKIVVELTGSESEVTLHNIQKLDQGGQPAETYTLTVKYEPSEAKTNVDYKTGGYGIGLPGKETDNIASVNVHDIHVFQRGLELTKIKEDGTALPGAEFVLYRSAAKTETGVSLESHGVSEGDYVEVARAESDTNGKLKFDPVAILNAGGQSKTEGGKSFTEYTYYLVETAAPENYAQMGAIPVKLRITDDYSDLDGKPLDGKPLVDQNQAYNWTQKAYLELQVENNSQSILQVGDADSWDSETRTLAYKVRNYYLYDLPMVGGIGTYWLTFLGAAVLAFALLLLRKREYTSSLQISARRQSDPHWQDERRAGGQKK